MSNSKSKEAPGFFNFRLSTYNGEMVFETFSEVPTKCRKSLNCIVGKGPTLWDSFPKTEEDARPYIERQAILPPYRVDDFATIYIEPKKKVPIVPYSPRE